MEGWKKFNIEIQRYLVCLWDRKIKTAFQLENIYKDRSRIRATNYDKQTFDTLREV